MSAPRVRNKQSRSCRSLEDLLVRAYNVQCSRTALVAVVWAALACLVRPTSALLWAPLAVQHLGHATNRGQYLLHVALIGYA
jgi:hypothetical protein